MADTAKPSARWLNAQRVRRTIVVLDVVESVRLMAQHEDAVIQRWLPFLHEARSQVLPAHGGQWVKSTGDGLLLTFDAVRPAWRCALALRACMARLNRAHPAVEPLQLRIGIHCADIVVDQIDIFGAAVNLTARLAGLAGADETVASVEALDEIVPGLDAEVVDLGDCYLKHLEAPVRAYRWTAPAPEQVSSGGSFSPAALPVAADLPRPKIAVLTLDGEAGGHALHSLVADEIAVQLSAHSTVDIVSRMSTRHLQGADLPALLQRLGASYAVCGSCLQVGDRLSLTIELVFARDQRVVWSQALRVPSDQLIADPALPLQRICGDIMASIEANETGRARSLPLASLGSYSLLIGGVRLMHRLSRADFDRAHEVLEALVARHPRHPDGHAWLAKWHILQVHQGWSADPVHSNGMARDLARRALERDDRCGVAMAVAGMVKTFNDRDLTGAERIYGEALATHPSDALTWLLKGTLHAFRGEGALAVAHTRRASELSPLDPMRYYFDSLGASAEASAGHFEEAVRLARRSLSANALHASSLRILTIAHAMLDQIEDARAVVLRLRSLEPDFSVSRFLARSPSADYDIGRTFADALARAGVPR